MKDEKPLLEDIFDFINKQAEKIENKHNIVNEFTLDSDSEFLNEEGKPKFTFTSGALDAYMG